MRRLGWVAVAIFSFCFAGSAAGATLRPIGGFNQPIYVTSSPGDPDRLLVAERKGAIVEVTPQARRQLADLSPLIACCESERGLLSIAPAPDFANSGRFYVAYTGTAAAGGAEGDVHLDSFRLDPAGGPPPRDPILSVAHSAEANHNGGQLQFGPDEHLYLSLGDGGGGGDPSGNAQNTEVLLGKILRIDPEPGRSPAYAIPPSNPFVLGPGRDEIWDYGLRNPWRFSFDRQAHDLVIADVGQEEREEVDFVPSGGGASPGPGLNFGWNCREGSIPYSGAPVSCPVSGFTDPVFDYPHEDPGTGAAHGCSIIGGYVVRDASVPDLYGRYVYTDYCTQEIRSLVLSSGGGPASGDRSEGLSVAKPISFGEDSCGRVYVASEGGTVYRVEGPTAASCPQPLAIQPIEKRMRRLLLAARRLRPGGGRFRVKVRLAPCGDGVGRRAHLRRGGRPLTARKLNRRCVARFRLRPRRRTALRAFVRIGPERLRSRRLVLRPTRAR
jgi:Glucose / Sorbosone dehydrogenase